MKVLDQERIRMVDLLNRLSCQEGIRPSLLGGVTLLRTTRSSLPIPVMYEPCIVIVAQGRKRFHLPDQVLTYDCRNYLVLTVPVPADCETEVGEDGPFLAVAIRIDLAVLSDLLMQMEPRVRPARTGKCEVRVSAPPMDPQLSNVTVRLLECLTSQTDAKVLGPQLLRELTYRVLCGEEGGAVQDLLLEDGTRMQVHRIVHRLHTAYASPLDVSALAQEAGMSVSALHFHFKAVTGTSPMQYLKTIRLHKAKMLMVQDAIGAASAAERVGYDSPSQFSREFKRMFGTPPADEAQRVRAAFGFVSGG